MTYYNQSTRYRQWTVSVSQLQQACKQEEEDTLSELYLRHNLHPWVLQLDDCSTDIRKLTIKHSRSANMQQ